VTVAREPSTPRGSAGRRRPLAGIQRWSVIVSVAVVTALSVLVVVGARSSLRAALAGAFYLAVPGWAAVAWLELDDDVMAWTMSIGLSVALGVVVAAAMLWTTGLDLSVAYWVLAGASAVSLVGRLTITGRRSHSGSG
jgi:uncharacterized membrane protein